MTKHIYGAVLRESEDGGWWAEVPRPSRLLRPGRNVHGRRGEHLVRP